MEGEQLRLAKGRKRLRALWELGGGERERMLRLYADELKSMEGEQLSEAEGEKILSMMDGEQLRLAKVGKRLQAL